MSPKLNFEFIPIEKVEEIQQNAQIEEVDEYIASIDEIFQFLDEEEQSLSEKTMTQKRKLDDVDFEDYTIIEPYYKLVDEQTILTGIIYVLNTFEKNYELPCVELSKQVSESLGFNNFPVVNDFHEKFIDTIELGKNLSILAQNNEIISLHKEHRWSTLKTIEGLEERTTVDEDNDEIQKFS